MRPQTLQIDVHLGPEALRAALAADVRSGLSQTPKRLLPKWLYDETGCELFDQITRLPEYYPTRREREILYSEAPAIARLSGADTLVEIGSGSSEKTFLMLDAIARVGGLSRFVPFDVAEGTVRDAARLALERYPSIEVHGVVGDFERHLDLLPRPGRRLVAFLGSTIGNLEPAPRAAFLAQAAALLGPEDCFLLGTDLVKDVDRLEAAYDDAAGVTAAFNLNVLTVLNRELGADFRPERFRHEARWNAEHEWIELLLVSGGDQRVTVTDLSLDVDFAAGEEMRTEISAKFRAPSVEAELEAAGLELVHWWTDSHGDFALSLSRRARGRGNRLIPT
jgi:L-histidine N-alpha-methyltransferase